MKTSFIPLLAVLSAFTATLMPMTVTAGVRSAHSSGADMTYEAPDAVTESVTVNKGETFTIKLDSNITTGYSWEPIYNDKYLRLVSSRYIHPVQFMNICGAGGQEEFVFTALKKGTTILNLNYRRWWEVGVDPIQQKIYRVTIPRNIHHQRGVGHQQKR